MKSSLIFIFLILTFNIYSQSVKHNSNKSDTIIKVICEDNLQNHDTVRLKNFIDQYGYSVNIVFDENNDKCREIINISSEIKKIRFYYPHNILKEEFFVINGKIDSVYKSFHPNGNLYQLNYLKKGKKNGKSIEGFPNGTLSVEADYLNDDLNGFYLEYYINGKLKSKKNFKFGKLFSILALNDIKGNKLNPGFLKSGNGFIYNYLIDDTNVSINSITNFKNGEKNGAEIFFEHYPNDTSLIYHYSKGKLNGVYKSFFKGKFITCVGNYSYGKKNGTFKHYITKNELSFTEKFFKDSLIEAKYYMNDKMFAKLELRYKKIYSFLYMIDKNYPKDSIIPIMTEFMYGKNQILRINDSSFDSYKSVIFDSIHNREYKVLNYIFAKEKGMVLFNDIIPSKNRETDIFIVYTNTMKSVRDYIFILMEDEKIESFQALKYLTPDNGAILMDWR